MRDAYKHNDSSGGFVRKSQACKWIHGHHENHWVQELSQAVMQSTPETACEARSRSGHPAAAPPVALQESPRTAQV